MKYSLLGFILTLHISMFSQSWDNTYTNVITTAVPFMNMSTNARLGGFGEIGTVSSPFYQDAGIYQNPALLSKNARYAGGNLSYSPFLPKISDNPYLSELNGFYSINSSNTIAYNFKLFNLGDVLFTDENGTSIGHFKGIEYFHQFTYTHSFKNGISIGGGFKYIRSDFGIEQIAGVKVKPGNAIAFDIGFNYGKGFELAKFFIFNFNVGANINNFGSKIKYVDDKDEKGDFLPTTLRFGILINPEFKLPKGFTIGIDLAYQTEKLLVPTPPIYTEDSDGNRVIEKGMDPDISPFRALYQSFYDAPYGFEEELNEIIHKFAAELRIDYQRKVYIAGRIGKFIEHETKGGRNYLTWGAGIGVYGFILDYKKIKFDNSFIDDTWALTFGFRTTISNPAFRF